MKELVAVERWLLRALLKDAYTLADGSMVSFSTIERWRSVARLLGENPDDFTPSWGMQSFPHVLIKKRRQGFKAEPAAHYCGVCYGPIDLVVHNLVGMEIP